MSPTKAWTIVVLLTAMIQSVVLNRTYAGQDSDEQFLSAAKSTLASQIEPGLPDKPVEAWLKSLVKQGAVLTWQLNDCGEQTGVPEIDNDRDLPICAALNVDEADRQIFLYFLVGTTSLGIVDSRGLYFVGISEQGSISSFDSLSALAAYFRHEQK